MDTGVTNFLFQSTEIDLARKIHEDVGISLDVEKGQSNKFNCNASAVITDEYSIYYKTYGAATILNAPPASDYWLSIPVIQSLDETGQTMLRSIHRPSRMACPGKTDPLRLPEGAEGLGIRFNQEALSRRLSVLTGKRVKGTIAFCSEFKSDDSVGQALANLTILAVRSPDDWSPMSSAIFRSTFSDMISNILLLNSPHSHDYLLEDTTLAGSVAVRKSIDYIHSHLDSPISLSDLAVVSGVPVRTLSYQFNRSTGYSPLGYMRRARLEQARVRLQREHERSITEIAFDLGFTNAGRFAGEYKACFGETPKQTRSRFN